MGISLSLVNTLVLISKRTGNGILNVLVIYLPMLDLEILIIITVIKRQFISESHLN